MTLEKVASVVLKIWEVIKLMRRRQEEFDSVLAKIVESLDAINNEVEAHHNCIDRWLSLEQLQPMEEVTHGKS